jgi:hypothetical protein
MGSVPPHQMPFSAGNSTDTISNGSWRQVGRLCWLRLHGRHPLSTRSRCAPIRSQLRLLRLLRLLVPASLTAGASAAASARSQILLQDGSACNLLLSPTALSTIKCVLACPHLRCRASRLAMRKRVYAGCCVPRLNRLPSVASRPCAPTGCTLPMSRPTCRRPPRGTSRAPCRARAHRACCARPCARAAHRASMRFAGVTCRCGPHLLRVPACSAATTPRRTSRPRRRRSSRPRSRRHQRARARWHARRRRRARGHRESECGSVLQRVDPSARPP